MTTATLNMTCLVFGALFLATGLVLFFGKGYTRLSVWKKMSDEERGAIRILPLCRNLGLMIGLCGLLFAAAGLSDAFKARAFTFCIIGWFGLCCADIVFIEKSRRYKNDPQAKLPDNKH